MASYCMHRSSITTILQSHRLSAHQHHGGLMDDCMSLTCYLAIDIDAYSLCVPPGVTPRSTATIILLNPVRINSCCLGQATVPSTGCLSYLPSPSTGSRLFRIVVYQSMSAGSLTHSPSISTQAKPREARPCENRKKTFFFCSLRREKERGHLETGTLIDVCIWFRRKLS